MTEPIRVLHVLGALNIGGAENLVMNWYRNIDRTKIQFDFIVHTSKPSFYDSEIFRHGGHIYIAPKFKGINLFQYIGFWFTFFKQHPEYKIIHGHVRSTAAIYLFIANRFKLITISHSHSTSSGTGFSAIVKNIMQFPIRWIANFYFAPSIESGKWLFGNKVKSDRFYLLKNGIDTESFRFNSEIRNEIRHKFNYKDEDKVFGCVGRLIKSKNYNFLLSSFKELEINNKKLLIIGDGPEYNNIMTLAKKLKIDQELKIVRGTNNVCYFLNGMDTFLFPSKFEGLGISVIEAEANGLPIILNTVLPNELDLTDLITRVPLNIDDWIKSVAKVQSDLTKRINYSELIRHAGYDIVKSTRWLEHWYLKKDGK
ncbi:glycosyltransferase [Leuconostoc lactis]|uniref:glycosyltransferase n=1 Tax=Leuconostoc lactis TaxID=1246 RepID=UPI00272CF442|nr:glycosyltransferase [Leuconostoc lactis]WKY78618.1 glycosyltransferase [Leuconostoc lactis]